MLASEIINHTQTLAGDPDGDYHDDDKMLLHLNTSLHDLATRSRSFCEWLYIAMIDGQGIYGLPNEFLDFRYVGFKYRGRLLDLSPGHIRDAAPFIFDDREQGYQLPHTYTLGGNAPIEHVVTTVESSEISDDGELNGYGEFVSTDPAPGALAGDRIINVTDGSEGRLGIPMLRESDDKVSFEYNSLVNGEDNKMEEDDVFRITSRSSHLHTIALAPPPRETDEIGFESLFAYISRTHRIIQPVHIQDNNETLEVDSEFQPALRHRILFYMRMDENGIDHNTTRAHNVDFETEYFRAYPKVRRRINEYLTAWRQAGQRIPKARTVTATGDWTVRLPFGR